ncbi:MAG: UvrD-helicase domain-containing protein [Proteobacteria bacterium]|nr:UvrD-helicase domain-containing protein [Cystobacterineae bacterium]MCL2259036.1 UvrD-helicase domain-containing protein [Cystobacterineae bacterium]MCL2313996.1 UvrD-helicase domain-containing protein [Pseudomonadota bacterium]
MSTQEGLFSPALAKLLRLDSNLALMASAGTGKTYNLISLCLHLLAGARKRGRVQPSKLCLVTFTDKATKEMQHRLEGRLKALCEGETKEPELEHSLEELGLPFPSLGEWKKIYAHLPSMQIGTFHNLCLKLIQLTTNASLRAELLNEVEATALLEHCVSQTLLSALESKHSAARQWVKEVGFGSFSRRQGVVYGFAKTLASLREEGFCAKQLRLNSPEVVQQKFQFEFQKLSACTEALLLLSGQKENQKKAIGRLRGELLETAEKLHLLALGNADTLVLLREANERFRNSRSADIQPLKQTLKTLESIYWEQQLLPIEELAIELLGQAEFRFEQELYSKNKVDFTSLLIRSRDGLRDFPQQRLAAQRQWQALLVDEFQDCNQLQLELTLLLSERRDEVRTLAPQEDWTQTLPLEPGFFCVVGDAKQSIYEFRGADVGVFSTLANKLKNEGGEVGFLKNSFRTQESLLHFFNAFFPKLFAPVADSRDFEVHYKNEADKLMPTRPACTGGPAVICLEDSTLDEVSLEQWRLRDAEAIAKGLSEIFQREPLKYSSVAVLFRRLQYAPLYLEALRKANIPAKIIQGTGFFGAQEVLDMLGFLTWLEDGSDFVSQLATLRSPWLGLSDETLLLKSLWEGTEKNIGPPEEEGEEEEVAEGAGVDPFKTRGERERYQKFFSLFAWLKKEKHRLGVWDILRTAMDATDFCQTLASFENGEQALANIDKFLEMAFEHDAKHPGDNAGFCQKMWHAIHSEQREMALEVADEDCVSLCTVHQAKGLEWPCVILADLNATAPNEGGSLLFERSLGLAVSTKALSRKIENDSQKMKALQKEWRLRRQAEAKRLLYVAMTRAGDKLVLGLTSSPKNESWAHAFNEILKPQATEDAPQPALDEALKTERWDIANIPKRPFAALAKEVVPVGEANAKAIADWKAPPLPLPREEVVFSITQLQAFERCPRRFFLQYHWAIDAGFPKQIFPQERAKGRMGPRERGEVTHRLLEHMPLAWLGDDKAERHLQELAERLGLPWEAQIFRWLKGFGASELGKLFLKAGEQGLQRELPFIWAIGGEEAPPPGGVLFLRGQIDALIEYEENRHLIVDYKTGTTENPKAHALQLACYCEAVRRWKPGTQLQAAVVFLGGDSPQLHPLEEGELAAYDAAFLRKTAMRMLDARASNVWPMRDSEECRAMQCPYISFCCCP